MRPKNNNIKIILMLMLLYLVSSCYSSNLREDTVLEKGEGLLIGRIELIKEGKIHNWGPYMQSCMGSYNEKYGFLLHGEEGFFAVKIPMESENVLKYGSPYTTIKVYCTGTIPLFQIRVPRQPNSISVLPAIRLTSAAEGYAMETLSDEKEIQKTLNNYYNKYPKRKELKEKIIRLDLNKALLISEY